MIRKLRYWFRDELSNWGIPQEDSFSSQAMTAFIILILVWLMLT